MKNKYQLIAIAAGCLVAGAGLALLFAPEKGLNTRKKIKNAGTNLTGQAQKFISNLKERNSRSMKQEEPV